VELMFRFDHLAVALLNAGHVDSELIISSPNSAPRRASDATRGGINQVLARRQATLGHDPPSHFRSTIAVR